MPPRAPTGEHVHDRDEHGPIARRGNTTILCRAQNVVDKGSTHSPTMHPAPAAVTIHRPQPSPCRTATQLMRNTQLAL